MRTVLALFRASHPEPALTVTAVAALLALAVGHHPGGTAAVTLTVLASQLAVSWTNDAIDAERDAAAARADKPIPTGAISRRTVAISGVVAAAATVPLALLCGGWAGLIAALGLVSSLLYNWPLKSMLISPLPYAVSFAALPAFVVVALPGSPRPPAWLVLAGGLLGAGAHFANTLPDLADDVRAGIRGLPHRIGPAWSRVAAAVLLLGTTAALTFGPPGPPGWFGLVALAAAMVALPIGWYAAGSRAGSRAAFRSVLVVALIDVVLLLVSGASI